MGRKCKSQPGRFASHGAGAGNEILMNINTLSTEIRSHIEAMRAANTATLRALRREYSKLLARTPPGEVIGLAQQLLSKPTPAIRFMAYELIHFHPATLASLRTRHLKQLGRNLDSWGAVDTFGCYLSGPAWREGQIPDAEIQRWAHSKNRWWRRAALVSTVPLNNKARGGKGDPARTLDICRLLIKDREDMVVKAMSWALRALSVRDPRSVQRFLGDHDSVLAPRVKREVRNKLSTGLKTPRRTRMKE